MTNHERLSFERMLDEVPISPVPLDTMLACGRSAKRRKQRTLLGGAAAVVALVVGGGVVTAQAFDPSASQGGTGDLATQPTTSPNSESSPYEVLRRRMTEVTRGGDLEIRAETAEEVNRELGLDDQDGFRYLSYGNESWCVTDGVAVMSFVYWGDGAAQLYTDASTVPTSADCATVGYDDPIPARVKVAFRTDPETHYYRLEKGRDLISQAMIDDIEGH